MLINFGLMMDNLKHLKKSHLKSMI